MVWLHYLLRKLPKIIGQLHHCNKANSNILCDFTIYTCKKKCALKLTLKTCNSLASKLLGERKKKELFYLALKHHNNRAIL